MTLRLSDRLPRFLLAASLAAPAPLAFGACSSATTADPPATDAGTTADDAPSTGDGAPDAVNDVASDVSKSAACTSSFGNALTAPYGRLDGTVLAVLEPGNQTCPRPNSTHIVIEVTAQGAAYRMVANVQSDVAGVDPNVRFTTLHAPLPSPAWGEGWHADAVLDYPTTLGVHAGQNGFTATPMATLVGEVIGGIQVGAKISVYASTSGGDSAHLIHRNRTNEDGAIVTDPDGASPTWMLFHFQEQSF